MTQIKAAQLIQIAAGFDDLADEAVIQTYRTTPPPVIEICMSFAQVPLPLGESFDGWLIDIF